MSDFVQFFPSSTFMLHIQSELLERGKWIFSDPNHWVYIQQKKVTNKHDSKYQKATLGDARVGLDDIPPVINNTTMALFVSLYVLAAYEPVM